MAKKSLLDHWTAVALAIVVVAIALRGYFWWQTQYTIDDALITMRYVRNLIQGEGFVYNPGEHVLGTTTPLWTLLLAGLGRLGLEPIATAKVLGIAADAVTVWSLFLIMRREGRPAVGLLAGAIFAVSPRSIETTISGMETPLVTLLGMASFYFFLKEKPLLGAGLASLLVLARIDGLVLATVLALWQALRLVRGQLRLKAALATLMVFACVQLPWLAFATWYFGSPLPNTMLAKAAAYDLSSADVIGIISATIAGGIAGKGYSFAFLLGSSVAIRRRSLVLPLVAWVFAYHVAFVIGRVPLRIWYFVPPTPAFFLLASLGLAAIGEHITLPRKRHARAAIWGALTIVLLGVSIIYLGRALNAMTAIQALEYAVGRSAGLWLNENAPPGSTIALEPLGYIGYYSDRHMLDFAGLVTPSMKELNRRRFSRTSLAIDDAVRQWFPDYVLLRPIEYEQHFGSETETSSWFAQHYAVAEVFFPNCDDCSTYFATPVFVAFRSKESEGAQ